MIDVVTTFYIIGYMCVLLTIIFAWSYMLVIINIFKLLMHVTINAWSLDKKIEEYINNCFFNIVQYTTMSLYAYCNIMMVIPEFFVDKTVKILWTGYTIPHTSFFWSSLYVFVFLYILSLVLRKKSLKPCKKSEIGV